MIGVTRKESIRKHSIDPRADSHVVGSSVACSNLSASLGKQTFPHCILDEDKYVDQSYIPLVILFPNVMNIDYSLPHMMAKI